jgi:membrane protein implicated in regulation of membrane protease activity
MGKGLNMGQYQKEHVFAGAIIAVGMICGSIALMKMGIIAAVVSSSSALPFIILMIGTTVISGGLITLGSAMWSRARSHPIHEEQAHSTLDKNRREPASA